MRRSRLRTNRRNALPVRPFYEATVNAGSSCQADYSSRNLDNVLEAPTTLEYRIDNLTDSQVILNWTSVPTPGTTGSVAIPASLNAMTRTFRDKQLNQVTFRATFADGSQVQSMGYYELCAVFQGAS